MHHGLLPLLPLLLLPQLLHWEKGPRITKPHRLQGEEAGTGATQRLVPPATVSRKILAQILYVLVVSSAVVMMAMAGMIIVADGSQTSVGFSPYASVALLLPFAAAYRSTALISPPDGA